MKLNFEQASLEFEVNRRTLKRRLLSAGLVVEKGTTYTVAEVHRALTGADADLRTNIDRARLGKLTAEKDLLESELATLRRESIPADAVERTWAAVVIALRQAIWNFDAPEGDRRRWLLELRDLKVEDYFDKPDTNHEPESD